MATVTLRPWSDDDVAKLTFCLSAWSANRTDPMWTGVHAAWLPFLDACAMSPPRSRARRVARAALRCAVEAVSKRKRKRTEA